MSGSARAAYRELLRGGFSLLIACGAIAVASPAFAQSGGLFGGTRPGGDSRDRLSIQMALAAAFDRQVAEGLPSLLPDTSFTRTARSTVLSGSLNYAGSVRNVGLTALASTSVRNNDQFDRLAMGSQNAQVGASFALPSRTSLAVTQTAAYSPSYLDQLFPGDSSPVPGEGLPSNPEYDMSGNESYSYQTRVALTRGRAIGTGVSATAEYGYQDVRQQEVTRPDVTTYGIGAMLYHAPNRGKRFSVGYRYRTGEFGSDGMTVGHEVTLGVSYSRALSISRRLSFGLEVTPTLLDVPGSTAAGIGGEEAAGQRLYPVQFDASVEYPFHLKWRANVSYIRSVSYLGGFNEPTISDSTRARVSGMLNRRMDVSFIARYATSGSTISSDSTYLGTYTGEARFQFALGRSFALYTKYLYTYYEDEAVGRPGGTFQGPYEQHGVRVGITVFTQPFGG